MKSKYFKAHELVSEIVYRKYSEDVIMSRANKDLIRLIDWIREMSGVPIVINNWKNGGSFQQRGYRSNMDQIVRDSTNKGSVNLSAHNLFMAADMNPTSSSGKSAEWLWDKIKNNASSAPCNFRMENKTATVNSKGQVSWVHVDVAIDDNDPIGHKKAYVFNP